MTPTGVSDVAACSHGKAEVIPAGTERERGTADWRNVTNVPRSVVFSVYLAYSP